MRDERGRWYLLTGLIIGAALGLLYAWLISPRVYTDTSPASLRADFKDQYRAMIAAAFVANGNLPRAQARLGPKSLNDKDAIRVLSEQAQRALAEGKSAREVQALGFLAVALGQEGTPVLTPLPPANTPSPPTFTPTNPAPTGTSTLTAIASIVVTQVSGSSPSSTASDLTPAVTRTSISTGAPLPTRTPTVTPGSPFVLKEHTFVCDQNFKEPLLQVLAEDALAQPLTGIEVIVTWEGGQDHFFTGLKPELGLGYADFTMAPGVVYTLQLAGGGQPVSDLTPAECETENGSRYWGSWLLVFSQP